MLRKLASYIASNDIANCYKCINTKFKNNTKLVNVFKKITIYWNTNKHFVEHCIHIPNPSHCTSIAHLVIFLSILHAASETSEQYTVFYTGLLYSYSSRCRMN